MITDEFPDLTQVQGNILRGYRKRLVRHLVLTVTDAAAARTWLGDAASGDPTRGPQITTAEEWSTPPAWCVNIGISHAGLVALEVPTRSLESFPPEFIEGMAARAVKLGDTGPSAPSKWAPEWSDHAAVHLMVSVHADSPTDLDEISLSVRSAGGGRAFTTLAELDGAGFDHGVVHFGYRDGISQPHFRDIRDPADRPDHQPPAEIGAALLGYKTPVEDLRWEVPHPEDLGMNGSFNAFRVLEQRVAEFEEFLTAAADQILAHPLGDELFPPGTETTWTPVVSRHAALRELVAAKLLGRWRNGVPLELSPLTPTPDPPIGDLADPPNHRINDYGYASDPDGERCPIGSHMRRCNPRDAQIVQRKSNHTRRIIRRGIPYGPPFDPTRPDEIERGLLGSFICASLVVQFEAIQYDWMNLGLQHPSITGTNDPVVGNNDAAYSSFDMPVGSSSISLRGFPRFVHTRGGGYFFLPSIKALQLIATGDV